MTVLDKPLTNLQLELLRLYSMELSEEELLEIRRLLANHFADKASDEMDKLWNSNQWSDDTMKEWLKGES
jgi:hypothetical protein